MAKALFYAPKVVEQARSQYLEREDHITIEIGKLDAGDTHGVKSFISSFEKCTTEPWEKQIIHRGPKKELRWNKTIGKAHQRRKQLARKWHALVVIYRTNKSNTVEVKLKTAQVEVKEQKRHSLHLERQAKSGFDKIRTDNLSEVGITDYYKEIKRERQVKERKLAEARRDGRHLCPATFTKFMGREQEKKIPMTPKHFKIENRKMKRRLLKSIKSMERHKEVGVDNVHAEMLQTAPQLFARILKKLWAKVVETLLIPEAWTTGVLFPLLKKGEQSDPANCRSMCMVSHVRMSEKCFTKRSR